MRFSPPLNHLYRSCLLLLLLAGFIPLASTAAVLDAEEQAFVTLINNYRTQNGLQPLKISDKLDAAASWMSTDMAQKNYFSHTDSLGRAFGTRLNAFGYAYSTWKGENIAAGNATASATFLQWKNSSGHNQNMLSANFKVMGIARAYSATSTYKWYWTNDFGGYDDSGTVTPPPSTDTTPPTAGITSPVNGATVSGRVVVRVTATDNVGVHHITFQVDANAPIGDYNAPYELYLDTTTLTNGSHTVSVVAYDAAGNTAKASVTFMVANGTTPVTALPAVPTGLRVAPQTSGALVSWTAGTGGGTPASYEVQTAIIINGRVQYQTYPVAAPTTSYRLTVATTGSYYVRVRAINAKGASAYTGWVNATIRAGS